MIRVRCPICECPMEGASSAVWPTFPFCSSRCRTIDLGRWLTESYGLPVEDPQADSGELDAESASP